MRARSLVVLMALLLVSACVDANAAEGGDGSTETTTPQVDFVGSMTLAPDSGVAGTTVTVSGTGLPASTDLVVRWSTVEGRWDLQGDMLEEYHGRIYDPVTDDLGRVQTDAQGAFTTTFEVPEGFGYGHDVTLVDADGVIRNQALFDVTPEVTVTPTEGPPGTPITIEVRGMGWQTLENTRTITYDNSFTGWMSAVTTDGHASTVIPATGGVGPHSIGILRGAYTFPYLNPAQSPRPDILVYEATFTVTDGDPVVPESAASQTPAAVSRGDETAGQGPWMTTDLASGPVGTPVTFRGEGFEAGAAIAIMWYRIVGNRVSGQGWDEQSIELASAKVGSDGTFEKTLPVPTDVGGPHRVEAFLDGEPVAETSFRVTPSAQDLPSASVPWGSDITIDLTGVGWTETANIYTLVYDNAYLGYACGFNSQGDVHVTLKATGSPGWHYVDLYPAIYKGKESPGQQNFRIPQLTYEADHPGEDLPAFHYAFYIEG